MTERAPIEVANLDRYGSSELPWSRAHDRLANSPLPEVFLGTSRPDGRPHAARVGALWYDGMSISRAGRAPASRAIWRRTRPARSP